MGAADALQQETSHFCLPVKLCLGHSKLLLSLSGTGGNESSLHPRSSLAPAFPVPRGPLSIISLPSRNIDAWLCTWN